jgi:CPA1 family monovalent cation:H+ antiporter
MVAVVVSGFVSRMLPLPIPRPLVQIVLGGMIGLVANLRVELDPEIFFLLFIPPLLFLDGWRIPKQGLLRDKGMIVALAFGLVFFTVLGLGLFIHWMIPAIPYAVAFALAAIVSPTDPIAVSAITERVPMPKRVMHVLEAESLLNDASGLVCFRFAVAAALTGAFSLPAAALAFLRLAAVGIALGAGLTYAAMWGKNWISRRFGEDSGSQVVITLLVPFAAYEAAEHFGGSGILAAVAAGITMSYVELSGGTLASTRVQRTAVWDTVQLALNGIMFVLLGEQLPAIFAGAIRVVQE